MTVKWTFDDLLHALYHHRDDPDYLEAANLWMRLNYHYYTYYQATTILATIRGYLWALDRS